MVQPWGGGGDGGTLIVSSPAPSAAQPPQPAAAAAAAAAAANLGDGHGARLHAPIHFALALLHARFSGLVRDFGFVVWSAITGAVVVFSWFHVNLLGIGLHSYGFSSGLRDAVWMSYVVQFGFVLAGTVDVLLRPNPARAKRAPAAAAAVSAP